MKRENGFSIIELLIVMAILGLVLAAISDMFVGLLRGYKQQSKIAQTNIEGIIGLELLRRDLESAGYGLPWSIPAGTTYGEAVNDTAEVYNDSPSNPPRAVLAGDNITSDPGTLGVKSGSDYLVIKAVNLARNGACVKWTNLITLNSGGTPTTTTWETASENLASTDRVIILSPGTPASNSRVLEAPTGNPIGLLKFNDVSSFSDAQARIVYGVAPEDSEDPSRPLLMPFNRSDYYVSTTFADRPGRCAPGTGTLLKANVSQADGGLYSVSKFPLLDCVADMQVVSYEDRDVPPDGEAETFSSGIATGSAQTIRDQLKEVRVYMLAHEGQRDTSYTHSTSTIRVGILDGATLYGRDFDLSGIANWQNYRWKVYTLIVNPANLR